MNVGIRERLVDVIRKSQDADGGFSSSSSPDPVRFSGSDTVYRTSFVASHVLIALASSHVEGVEDVKKAIAGFLLRQISETGAVNYWARESPEMKVKPYPDDLDDTACAIAALALYDKKILDGELLGKIVQALLACEVQPGGPYRTWLISEDANPVWRDIDPAVNAHLAFALGVIDIDLQGLDAYLARSLETGVLQSPYYPDELSCLAALSRRPKENASKIAARVLALRRGDGWGNPVADALALGILLRLGDTSGDWEKRVRELAASEQALLPYAFCIDPAQKGIKHYCGSAALTAALVLEALVLSEQHPESLSVTGVSAADQVHAKVVECADTFARGLAPEFSKEMRTLIENAVKKDTSRQITLTPFFASTLLGERSRFLSDELLVSLGLASLYGWLAYTLFDDVMDGDRTAGALPYAASCLREMQSIFDGLLPEQAEFHRWQKKMLNRVDACNTWELSRCRFPVRDGYLVLPASLPAFKEDWMLFGRSIGHAVGPIAILCALGEMPDGAACQELLHRYCELILVKQMHDDAHDWESDLMRGQINSAGARVLARWYQLHPEQRGVSVRPDEVREAWRTIFWMEILPGYTEEIVRRCERSLEELRRSTLAVTPDALIQSFQKVALGATEALVGRQEMMAFLKTLA